MARAVSRRSLGFLAPVALVAAALASGGCEKLPNIPPTASFVFSPVSPIFAGTTNVVFNASGSRDSDGKIAFYVWDFGDGTPQSRQGEPTVTHVFPVAGQCLDFTYAVLLTTIDDAGAVTSTSQNVTVTQPCQR